MKAWIKFYVLYHLYNNFITCSHASVSFPHLDSCSGRWKCHLLSSRGQQILCIKTIGMENHVSINFYHNDHKIGEKSVFVVKQEDYTNLV